MREDTHSKKEDYLCDGINEEDSVSIIFLYWFLGWNKNKIQNKNKKTHPDGTINEWSQS